MKIYIASKFSSRHRLRPIKFKLKQLGFEVLSDWIDNNPLDESIGGDYDSIPEHLEAAHAIAQRDIEQVTEADIFIIDTQDVSATGGREVELGIILALKTYKVFRVGPIRNVFHAHKHIRPIKSWEEMIIILETL